MLGKSLKKCNLYQWNIKLPYHSTQENHCLSEGIFTFESNNSTNFITNEDLECGKWAIVNYMGEITNKIMVCFCKYNGRVKNPSVIPNGPNIEMKVRKKMKK